MAFTNGAYTYIFYVDDVGSTKVAIETGGAVVATRTLHATLEVDDHDNPTAYIRPDGKLHVFYSRHVGADIYERISTNTLAADPTISGGFASENSLSGTFGASASTYPSALYLSNVDGAGDSVFVFWRETGAGQEWWYATNDFSTGWAGPVALHSFTYSKVESDGVGRIDMAASDHPFHDGATKIVHLYREAAAWHETDGTTIGGSLPFGLADVTTVYSATGSDTVWIADLAMDGADPVIVFFRYPSDDTSDIRAMYARWDGAAWDVNEIVATGGYIPTAAVGANPLEVHYPGGLALDHGDPSIAYISREISGQWEMFKYVTADGGATWTNTQLTSGSTDKQIRPLGVRDADTIPLVWLSGTYASYVDYSLGIKALIP